MKNEYVISGSIVATDIWSETALPEVRFVVRDGEKILQQKWFKETTDKREFDWRDVPTENE